MKFSIKKILNNYGQILILIVLIILATILTQGVFLRTRNLLNILRQVSMMGLISLGVTLVIITKGIDLSSGAILALVTVVVASLTQQASWELRMFPNLLQLPIVIPILIGLLIGVICGGVNGAFIAYAGIPAFIATLGMQTATRGLAFVYSNGNPVSTLVPSYTVIGQGSIFGVPIPVIIFLIFTVITYIMLNYMKFGKFIYAIGGNENAAVVSGIPIQKVKILVYAYAGILSAIAGIILSSRINSGQPGLGLNYELDAIASATVGGVSHSGGIGTIGGTFVGILIMGTLTNTMDLMNISPYWQQVVRGAIIVAAVCIDTYRKKRAIS